MLDRILAILRWPIDVILMFLGVTAAYLHDLEEGLTQAQEEIQAWQTGEGERHLNPQIAFSKWAECPGCQKQLSDLLSTNYQEQLDQMTEPQAKEIARKFKLWPPPNIEIGDNLLSGRRSRR